MLLLPVLLAGALVPVSATASPSIGLAAPTAETNKTFNDDAGGNVDSDDPELWIHPDDDEDSIVIGAEKEHGMSVFNLHGHKIQHIPGPAALIGMRRVETQLGSLGSGVLPLLARDGSRFLISALVRAR